MRRTVRTGLWLGIVAAIVLAILRMLREEQPAAAPAAWSPPLQPRSAPEPQPQPESASPPAPAETAQTWVEPDGKACPASHPIKANANSGIYHVPGGLAYERTVPERCYVTEEAAEADGFRRAKR
ncbi:MAG: hypothetical protein ACRD0G_09095 [Acidimicrobiales bacterium]